MSQSRLTLALNSAALKLPESGRIAVFHPVAGADLSGLPKDRVHVIQPLYPDHKWWRDSGCQIGVAPEGDYSAAVVFLARAKALNQAMVADAARVTGGGLVIVDGQKTDGADSLLKALRKKVIPGDVISKAHGKLVWFTGGDFQDWAAQDKHLPGGFVTRPGVFSADAADKGSTVLIETLPGQLAGRVADLGAGWGYLARNILTRDSVTSLDLIEADHIALDCARRNVTDPRARFIWTDATNFRPDEPYDVVVTNPPFHTGRAGDPNLGRAFIRAAADMLTPSGQLWIVANRHLPYETTLAEVFREAREIGGDSGFKVLQAAKRIRKAR